MYQVDDLEQIKTKMETEQENLTNPQTETKQVAKSVKEQLTDLLNQINENVFVPTLAEKMQVLKLQKKVKQQVRFMNKIKKYSQDYKKRQVKERQALRKTLRNYRQKLTKDVFNQLAGICTVVTPEVLDADGKVTQQGSAKLNTEGFLAECKNMEALAREDRILNGKRKRSTGGRSNRKAHRASVDFINKRSEEASLEIK